MCQQNAPPTASAVSTAIELRLINVRRDCGYYMIRQREYGMTKKGEISLCGKRGKN